MYLFFSVGGVLKWRILYFLLHILFSSKVPTLLASCPVQWTVQLLCLFHWSEYLDHIPRSTCLFPLLARLYTSLRSVLFFSCLWISFCSSTLPYHDQISPASITRLLFCRYLDCVPLHIRISSSEGMMRLGSDTVFSFSTCFLDLHYSVTVAQCVLMQ